ncbi:MAG: Kdo hydroxylase family protein [Micavibrio sp.]|nr:Kdo hydroxylase family protein [Micavibrio sp.]
MTAQAQKNQTSATPPEVDILRSLPITSWSPVADPAQDVGAMLETGLVPYFPSLSFDFKPEEKYLLSDSWSDGKAKNITLRPNGALTGATGDEKTMADIHGLLTRYSAGAKALIAALIPGYVPNLINGNATFRNVEIHGRKSSWRKDDTRLHVDAFPSNPTQGMRLLRVFTNVNPNGKPREWRVGEPFADFAQKFMPQTKAPFPGYLAALKAVGITKKRRSLYDHMMLQLHDSVKADMEYQRTAPQKAVNFMPGTTWLVYSDQVLHAAMAGQFMMEQTFYLPANAMQHPESSVLSVLEKLSSKKLLTAGDR